MNLQTAIESGQAGLMFAVEHSDEVSPTWKAKAVYFFKCYCMTHKQVFPETVFRQYAGMGKEEPTALRAYGWIVRHAKEEQWIAATPCDVQRRVLGHGAWGPVWESLICGVGQ